MTVICNEEPLLIVNVWLGSILNLRLDLTWLDVSGISDSQGSLKGYIESSNTPLFKIWAESFLVRLVFLHFYHARIVNSSISIYLISIRTRWDLVNQDETTCAWEADTEIMSCVCWLQKKSHNYHVFEPILALSNFLKKPYPCSSLFFSRSF